VSYGISHLPLSSEFPAASVASNLMPTSLILYPYPLSFILSSFLGLYFSTLFFSKLCNVGSSFKLSNAGKSFKLFIVGEGPKVFVARKSFSSIEENLKR